MENNPSRSPKVSVMMCVYNGEARIKDAVDSILNQSFTDFELIVVDDGSIDDTAVILQSITDPRLHVFTQRHKGIPQSRNYALAQARGEYLAVLDADDIAKPSRLSHQVAFLDTNPQVVLLGSGYVQHDHIRNRAIPIIPPTDDTDIRQAIVKGNPFCHSTVMMRRTGIAKSGPYSEDFPYVQDYELWSRLAVVGEMANLPDVLVTRHFHERSVSTRWRTEFLRLSLSAQATALAIQRLEASRLNYFYLVRAILIRLFLDVYGTLRTRFKRQHVRR